MLIEVLKSKIHRAKVTGADLNYVGSITLDPKLMKKANIYQWEKVLIANISTGERFETYVIEGKENSGDVILNGAAARKVHKDDLIIIMSFCQLEKKELEKFTPTILQLNGNNIVN
jgi:aspartate 1-decarboxylase